MATNRAPRTSSPPAPSAGPWGFLAERWELVTLAVLAIAPLVIPALGGALGVIAHLSSLSTAAVPASLPAQDAFIALKRL